MTNPPSSSSSSSSQTARAEKHFGDGSAERRQRMADERRKELSGLRDKLMAGNKESVLDQFGDVLNSSANKIKKTKVGGKRN